MITENELMRKIEEVTGSFRGRGDHLSEVIGMMVLGRLVGWRVVRLISSRRCWMMATKLFGDPKELLPERGPYAHKSYGLKMADKLDSYWDLIRGSCDALPLESRKEML